MSEEPDAAHEAAQKLATAELLLSRERFSQARFDVGYERADVDVLLAALRSRFAETGGVNGIVESYPLRTAGFRQGYEVSEVEAWLTELAAATGADLGHRAHVGPTVNTMSVPVSSETRRGIFARLHRSH